MATCFVYIRKSTNRADKQKNSIPLQTSWVEDVLRANPDFDVIGLDGRICDIPQNGFIIESVSGRAESSEKRSGFQSMMTAIKEHWVDYVISCYVSRISRNTMDAAIFMETLGEKNRKIRLGVITQGRSYLTASPNDLIDLESELFRAKQDNSRLSISSKENHNYFKGKESFFYQSLSILIRPIKGKRGSRR